MEVDNILDLVFSEESLKLERELVIPTLSKRIVDSLLAKSEFNDESLNHFNNLVKDVGEDAFTTAMQNLFCNAISNAIVDTAKHALSEYNSEPINNKRALKVLVSSRLVIEDSFCSYLNNTLEDVDQEAAARYFKRGLLSEVSGYITSKIAIIGAVVKFIDDLRNSEEITGARLVVERSGNLGYEISRKDIKTYLTAEDGILAYTSEKLADLMANAYSRHTSVDVPDPVEITLKIAIETTDTIAKMGSGFKNEVSYGFKKIISDIDTQVGPMKSSLSLYSGISHELSMFLFHQILFV